MPQRPSTTLGIAASSSTSVAMGAASRCGRDLGQEERDRDRERRREQQRDQRGDDRPVDERERAVDVRDRVPRLRPDERERRTPGSPARRARGPCRRSGRAGTAAAERRDRDALEEDVAEPDPAALEVVRGRRGVVSRSRSCRSPVGLAWIFLISRYANPLTGVGSGDEEERRAELLALRDRPVDELPQVGRLRRVGRRR